ncbi:MAG: hypothetical protein U0350_33285 [Caldilineaceae bacterium]
MQIILADHNCEGQAEAIFNILRDDKTWLELVPMSLYWFHQVGLSAKASDQTVWQLCQARDYLLLTGNRTTKDKEKSLEFSIRRLLTSDSLPVLTIGNLKRVNADPNYCRACAERLVEIVDELHKYRGIIRLYLP